MTQHTPGRLQLRGKYIIHAEGRKDLIADVTYEANACRLVACWNACEPIADPENVVPRLLALNERVPEMEHQLAALRAQRDELLAALREIESVGGQSHNAVMVTKIARAAIAKVEKS